MSNELPTRKQLISQIIDLRSRMALLEQELKEDRKKLKYFQTVSKKYVERNRHLLIELNGRSNTNGNKRVWMTKEEWQEYQKSRGHKDDDD